VANAFEDVNRDILAETQKLTKAYSDKFQADPEGELRAWLQIAARREALVTEVYGEAERTYRLPEPRCPAAEVAWEALTLIWQQEAVHTKFIEVRLADGTLKEGTLTADLLLWLGTMEGKFLSALTRRPGLKNMLAGIAVRLGALFTPGKVPTFTLELGEMDPAEFFLLCATLETTARQAYTRMEALAEELVDKFSNGGRGTLQLKNLSRELYYKTLDETFHEQAFQEMATWVTDGKLDPSLAKQRCGDLLAALLPRATRGGFGPEVLTDGGLGTLFRQCGVTINVVGAEA
jgi:hypothetical protein